MARPAADAAFSDSDWTSEAPAASERRDHRVAAALAAGVAIGALGATLVWWFAATVARAPQRAPAPVAATSVPAATAAPAVIAGAVPPAAASDALPAPAAVAAEAVAAVTAPVATPAAHSPTADAPQPQAALADEAARRKERAWRKFYQPPPICSEDRRGDFLVECANHSIRARKEFEERYATGRL